jgi:hypothetical protein
LRAQKWLEPDEKGSGWSRWFGVKAVPTAPLTLPLRQKHCRSMCGCNRNGSDAMQSTTQHEVDREEKELRPPRAIPVANTTRAL